jgi:hypothetical protein
LSPYSRASLRPACAPDGYVDSEDLAGSGNFLHAVHAEPLRRSDVEPTAVLAAKHHGERAPVEFDFLQDAPALAHATAASVGNVRVPDLPFSVES